ncbi:MAG TPA: hypothetical protein DEG43_04020 [Acidimicrobiaceae bacterium]|jgi:hypothetical protein|nr:hypothetical protein [Acidimicrobiaceae bacterium]
MFERRALLKCVLAVAMALGTVSCASGGMEIVIPDGTQQRIDAGQTVELMPALLEFRVGDTLVIRNEDTASQYVGPYFVKPQSTVTWKFSKPATYEGACELNGEGGYKIVVTN